MGKVQTMQPFQVLGVLMLLMLPAASMKTRYALDMSVRPVMQVVRLLQDTKGELQAELKDDEEVHTKLDCWCKENDMEKSASIARGKSEKARLTAIITEQTGKIKELSLKREATYKQLQADKASLQSAREMRMKDNQEFQKQEMDLIAAVKAAHGAIIVLSEQNKPAGTFAQIRAKVRELVSTNIIQNAQGSLKQSAEMLTGLLQNSDGDAFLQRGSGPGAYQSYAPQSSQVFGILKQMKEDFEQNLKELRATEAKALLDFDAVKKAKDAEIALGEADIIKIDEALGDAMETKSSAEKDLVIILDQLKLDQTFMANLERKCGADYDEYDQRKENRLAEIAAVDDAIKTLNSDESFSIFEKMKPSSTPLVPGGTFLQISSSSKQKAMDRARRRAVMVLQEAVARSGSAQLARLAASVRLDDFKKVKAEIDKMVKALKQQQVDETVDKDQCLKDLRVNTRDLAASQDSFEALTSKKDVLTSALQALQEGMADEKQEMVETQASMKKKSEQREADNALVQQTIADHQVMSMLLQKSIDRMKQVYLFLQQQPGGPHTQTTATDTDPGNGPASFKKYTAGSGPKVVEMMENVLEHTKQVENEAIKDETVDQQGYEEFMKDSNRIIKAAAEAMAQMKEEFATKKESLSITNSDLSDTTGELKNLNTVKSNLHANCDYVINNFDMRQEQRQREIDALGEAKAILSGMN